MVRPGTRPSRKAAAVAVEGAQSRGVDDDGMACSSKRPLEAGECGVGRRLHSAPCRLAWGLFRLERATVREYLATRNRGCNLACMGALRAGALWRGVERALVLAVRSFLGRSLGQMRHGCRTHEMQSGRSVCRTKAATTDLVRVALPMLAVTAVSPPAAQLRSVMSPA